MTNKRHSSPEGIRHHEPAAGESRAGDDFYRRLFLGSNDAIILHEIGSGIVEVNAKASELLGYSEAELCEMTIGDLVAADRPDPSPELIEELRRDKGARFETEFKRADGKVIAVEISSSLIDADRGLVQGCIRDISKQRRETERVKLRTRISTYKQAEESLRRAHEELIKINSDLMQARQVAEDTSQAKSEFLAFISHEIRTPLNAILGILDILDETRMPSKEVEYIRTLRVSANSLMEILNDILDFSRAEAGMLELSRIPFNPGQLLEQSMRLVEASARRKGLALDLDIAPDCRRLYLGDEGRVQQIILNLISNAVKFTPSGWIAISLSKVKGGTDRALLRFEVADTGVGISAPSLETIFDRFAQGQGKTTGGDRGSGLGLTISRQLVEMMGGNIGVESKIGSGSLFWVSLPFDVHRQDASPAGDGDEDPQSKSSAEPPLAARILLVEDDVIIQSVASTILERIGCEVVIAGDGMVALECLERDYYDIIFMDCQMPRLNGFETTLRIRAGGGAGAETPIIAITANAQEGDREKCLEVGMNDYLCKPVGAGELRQMARKWYSPRARAAE